MSLRAVLFDLGGVLYRTEHQAPREHLAQRLGLTYEELAGLVFDSPGARQASIGALSAETHWKQVLAVAGLPAEQAEAVKAEFFGGDVLDMELADFLRSLRQTRRTGLLSNAFSDLRAWIISQKFDDCFDAMIISAEAGCAKPDPAIYRLALERMGTRADETVFVDDMPANIAAARQIGMQAIQFTDSAAVIAAINELIKTGL